jgi:DNA end-binding protein Ku
VPRKTHRSSRAKAHRVPSTAVGDEVPVGRALWSGSITFGLVTVPVELYTASRGRGVHLRMLGPEGQPLAREYTCPTEDRKLEADEVERGYEVDEGEWVLVSDDELEALAPRRSRDIELARFVDRAEVDPAWFVRPYFLVPGADQSKAYRLLADTMERTGRCAIASFVMRGKAYPVAIFAEHGLLRAETLRHGDELRPVKDLGLPKPRKPDEKRLARMTKAIDALAADQIDESELVDETARALLELAEKKRKKGKDVVEVAEEVAEAADEEEGGEVVDLVALIKKRLDAKARSKTAKPSPNLKKASARPRPREKRAG